MQRKQVLRLRVVCGLPADVEQVSQALSAAVPAEPIYATFPPQAGFEDPNPWKSHVSAEESGRFYNGSISIQLLLG